MTLTWVESYLIEACGGMLGCRLDEINDRRVIYVE